MIEKTIYLYEYKELNDEAREKVKQWYLNDAVRTMMLTDDFECVFLNYFFPDSNLKVEWSLNSCQGDGVNIYGDLRLSEVIRYIEKWNPDEHTYKYVRDPRGTFTQKELRRLRFYVDYDHNDQDVMRLPGNRRYTYCVADQAEFAEDMIDVLDYWNLRDIDADLIRKFESACVDIVQNLCAEMEDYGYKYLYEVEDDEVEEACEANEWYFTAEGKLEAV